MNWELELFYWTGWLFWEVIAICVIIVLSILVYERVVSYWAFGFEDNGEKKLQFLKTLWKIQKEDEELKSKEVVK